MNLSSDAQWGTHHVWLVPPLASLSPSKIDWVARTREQEGLYEELATHLSLIQANYLLTLWAYPIWLTHANMFTTWLEPLSEQECVDILPFDTVDTDLNQTLLAAFVPSLHAALQPVLHDNDLNRAIIRSVAAERVRPVAHVMLPGNLEC